MVLLVSRERFSAYAVARDNWFRNTTWNAEIAAAFEARLQRSRSAFRKAQYIRIQGLTLLESGDPRLQNVGVEMTRRVIEEYPEEQLEITLAYGSLGDHYLKKETYLEAEKNFRMIPQVMDRFGNASEIWQVKLAMAILGSGQRKKYAEAKDLIEKLMLGDRRPLFNVSLFSCYLVLARLSKALGEDEVAAIHAQSALRMTEIKTPQFRRHPTVGIVKTDPNTIAELSKMVAPRTAIDWLADKIRRFRQAT